MTLVVDNTAPQTQRSKCATPPQSFLTDQHPIYGGKAEVVRTQQSGGYWHFRMWISEERKYVRYHGIWDTNEFYDLENDPMKCKILSLLQNIKNELHLSLLKYMTGSKLLTA